MRVVSFGEIIFDCYPTGEKIGGAPFNFAAHLAALGDDAFLFGAIGQDALGSRAKQELLRCHVHDSFLQETPDLPTGVCRVTYQGKEPRYDLSQHSAYDAILEQRALYDQSFDVLYFGTLAQRSETSRKTLQNLLKNGRFGTVFFDMNLRQNYYCDAQVTEGLHRADVVKMNREEFHYAKQLSACPKADLQQACRYLCQHYGIAALIVTLDQDGAACCDARRGFFALPAQKGSFVSAVGAGDSFSACFLHHWMQGKSPRIAMEKAGILASYVVSQEEAVPPLLPHILEKIR